MFEKIKAKLRKRHDKQHVNPTLLERMNRNDPEDQIEIGSIIETALCGDFGNILNLIINGMIDEELASSLTSGVNADRTLGRIETLNKLQDRLDFCIEQKRQMQEVIKDESEMGDLDDSIADTVGPQAE